MSTDLSYLAVKDATGTTQSKATTPLLDDNGNPILVNGQPILIDLVQATLAPSTNIIGTTAPRAPQGLTMTVVTLTAGQSTLVIAANPTRKSLQIINIGTGFATAKTFATAGSNSVVVNQGYPLEAASAAGHQGGSTPIYDGVATSLDEWDAISSTGTTLLVVEGN